MALAGGGIAGVLGKGCGLGKVGKLCLLQMKYFVILCPKNREQHLPRLAFDIAPYHSI